MIDEKGVESAQSKDRPVEDIEQDRVGAHAEKPIRDIARREDVTEDERAILDKLAGRLGDEAMQEYAEDKEKNPVERLLARMDKIAADMRKKGLEEDAEIVDKIKGRFDRYAASVRETKQKLEDQFNERLTFQQVQSTGRRVNTWIAVVHEIGKGGGWLYWPNGSCSSWFGGADKLEESKEFFDGKVAKGREIINFSFSKEGEEEFYRALGVFGEKEEVIDIPKIYEEAARSDDRDVRIDPREYLLYFPTDIDGLSLGIKNEQRRSHDGKKEKRITLEFNDDFMEEILARE